MPLSLTRRQFLRGNLGAAQPIIRPPWAVNHFSQLCNGCGECVTHCPEKIISLSDSLPLVDFAKGECTFCARCVEHCSRGALNRGIGKEARPWRITASITTDCLALRMVICDACREHCAYGAIGLRMRVGGIRVPQVESSKCSGCGACYYACPEQAISLTSETSEKNCEVVDECFA